MRQRETVAFELGSSRAWSRSPASSRHLRRPRRSARRSRRGSSRRTAGSWSRTRRRSKPSTRAWANPALGGCGPRRSHRRLLPPLRGHRALDGRPRLRPLRWPSCPRSPGRLRLNRYRLGTGRSLRSASLRLDRPMSPARLVRREAHPFWPCLEGARVFMDIADDSMVSGVRGDLLTRSLGQMESFARPRELPVPELLEYLALAGDSTGTENPLAPSWPFRAAA